MKLVKLRQHVSLMGLVCLIVASGVVFNPAIAQTIALPAPPLEEWDGDHPEFETPYLSGDGNTQYEGDWSQEGVVVDHSAWDAFLARFVVTDRKGLNRVAYRCVPNSWKKSLNHYLCYLQSIDASTLTRDEALCYWLNLYNARTVALLVEETPALSILQVHEKKFSIKGPFDDKILCINGERASLSQIENDVVRAQWDDPRVHYALNCASVGCPNLKSSAWRPETLEHDLQHAAFTFINSGRAVKVDCLGKIKASKIYEWYMDDFGGSESAVLEHLRQYAKPKLRRQLSCQCNIDRFTYNWLINAARKCPSDCGTAVCDSCGPDGACDRF